MPDAFLRFEAIVRRATQHTEARSAPTGGTHPFDERDIYPGLPSVVRDLFDDGHYAQATFEAFKFIDKEIQRHSKLSETGFKLMMQAFQESAPRIQLTPLATDTHRDEQKGFQFLFAGSVLAIRNPRAHEVSLPDHPDQCLDHLSLASLLLRRLHESNFICGA
ncbi:MAG: TIGR02391 family protein [Defluviicoccus sp.]|nr:TIGR02391 family protein [Defluviicoccus sp.]MDG4608454.1 TIGR02391 family protein [Defluviicoccus sp.]